MADPDIDALYGAKAQATPAAPAPQRAPAGSPQPEAFNSRLDAYDNDFSAAEQQYGVPARLLKSIAHQESRGNPKAVSDQGAIGLMQILPDTAKTLGVDPRDPHQSILGAAHYIRQAIDHFGNTSDAVASYHGGFDQSKWGPKTENYRQKVLAQYGDDNPFNGLTSADAEKVFAERFGSATPPQAPQAARSASAPQPVKVYNANDAGHGTAMVPGQLIQDADGNQVRVVSVSQMKPGDAEPDPSKYTKVMRGGQTIYFANAPAGADYPNAPAPSPQQLQQKLAELQITPQDRAAVKGNVGALAVGLGKGVQDIPASLDPVASWLAHTPLGGAVDRAGVAMGLPSADEAHANNVSLNRQYNALLGNNSLATGARIAGNIAGSAPLMEVAGARLAPLLKGAGPVGEFVAGKSGGNLLMRAASQGTNGAIQGGTAAALTSGGSEMPVGDQIRSGALFGGTLGSLAPVVGAAGKMVAGSGNGGAASETAALARKARDEFDIPIRAGQVSGSPFVKYLDSSLNEVPLSGYAKSSANQRQAFSKAVAKTIGEDAPGLTQDVMAKAKARIGGEFDRVAKNTTITNSDSLLTNLGSITKEASSVLPEGEVSPLLNQVESIASAIDPKTRALSGEGYQALTRKGAPLDRLASSSNPNLRHYAQQMRGALDDALQASASGEDVAALKAARRQYKNLKTIEDLSEKAGPDGDISPASLLSAVRKSYGSYAYSGAGDMGDLAKIGQRFLKEPPNSGTATRHTIMNMLTLGGPAMAAEMFTQNPVLAAKVAAGTAALAGSRIIAGRLVGTALDNPLTRAMALGPKSAAAGPVGQQSLMNQQGKRLIGRALPIVATDMNRLQQPAT